MPPEVGLGDAVAGLVELEPVEQLTRASLRRAFAEVVEAPDHLEVLVAGEVLVDGGRSGPSPMWARSCGACFTTSKPAMRALPWSGLEQRGEDAHGRWSCRRPFGPSRPSTVPSCASRSMPSSATTSPYVLASPVAVIAGSDIDSATY
jgi:hypothetical protein